MDLSSILLPNLLHLGHSGLDPRFPLLFPVREASRFWNHPDSRKSRRCWLLSNQ